MKSEVKNGLKIGCIFVGNILGAGFASGKELITFFCNYGKEGIIGLAVCSIMFGVLCFDILKICREKNLNSYEEFNYYLFGRKIGILTEIFSMLLTVEIFATMIAGGGQAIGKFLGEEGFFWNILIGMIIFAALIFDLKGVARVNTVLCPLLIAGGIITSIYIYRENTAETFAGGRGNWYRWLISAFIYVSYNGITIIPVMASMNEIRRGRKCEIISGLVSGGAIFLIGSVMLLPLYAMYERAAGLEIPFLEMTEEKGGIILYLYFIVFIASVFTTAVGNGFGIVEWLSAKSSMKKIYIKIIVCTAVVLISKIGFSTMVERVYPLFGCIGICEIAAVFVKSKKVKKYVDKNVCLW